MLRAAVELGRMPLQEIYFENTPAALIGIANETVEKYRLLSSGIAEFSPVLQLFKLDGNCPATSLDAVAKAVIASNKISQEHRPALYLNQKVDVAAFGLLRERWVFLIAKEREWRQYLSAYGQEEWPAPGALRSASELLKKGNLGRAMAAISGSAKPARDIVARLGLADSERPADDLAALANHVDAIDAFEADDDAERLLGPSWLGLETKFDLIDFGIRVRRYLTEQVGHDLMLRLLQIPPEMVLHLHKFEAAATNLRKIIARAARLDDRSVDLTMGMLDDEIQLMQRVVALEEVDALAGFEIPVRELVEIAKLELDRGRIRAILDTSPLKVAVEHFAGIRDGVAKAFAALDWLRAVKSTGVPENMLRRLGSPAAANEFARLKSLTTRAAGPLAVYDGQVELLSSQFGAIAYARSEPGVLSNVVAALLERKDELREMLGLYRERRILESLGLGGISPNVPIASGLSRCISLQVLDAVLARRGAELAKKSAGALQDNTGSSLETRRKQFAEKDRAKIKDDRLRIKAKLLTKRPLPGLNFGKKKTWTEMAALLGNEIAKQKRFVPVRTLLAQAGKSIQALKPCFMMSPLSLAKFMKAGSLSFDILVIDEASQMRPEDALVTRHASIETDSGGRRPEADCLRPTFSPAPETEGLAMKKTSRTSTMNPFSKAVRKHSANVAPLRWHYRSRCESLIRFSNEQFYRRELITFPASKPSSFSIDLVRVQGTFQARCNPTEASRVAEEAITFMRHHAALGEDEIPSLGIAGAEHSAA